MKYKKLSIVVPIYNEEKTLEKILSKIESLSLNIEKEIILVNDASKDNTLQILQRYTDKDNFIILHNEQNLGKSQTVKKGLLESTGDLVVIQDADLEYNPENWQQFLPYFEEHGYDIVYGNRFGKNNKVIYWQNWFGNRFLSIVSSCFTYPRSRMMTTDMEVCYKMARGSIFREIAKTIRSKSNFGLEPEVTAKFSKFKIDGKHLKFKQIAIDYAPRSVEEGKHMKAFSDGFKALWEILKFNLWR
ncbi:glycosyltransferase family 2 protein [Candidatus Uabimicrobium sp. HlEnr_7]|uniref:glycosyltransferase family 2 protein n=1 Tax=Candidatus Uabimicrobium helgolandensis TaxID=3095367 RepID=UPI003556261B